MYKSSLHTYVRCGSVCKSFLFCYSLPWFKCPILMLFDRRYWRFDFVEPMLDHTNISLYWAWCSLIFQLWYDLGVLYSYALLGLFGLQPRSSARTSPELFLQIIFHTDILTMKTSYQPLVDVYSRWRLLILLTLARLSHSESRLSMKTFLNFLTRDPFICYLWLSMLNLPSNGVLTWGEKVLNYLHETGLRVNCDCTRPISLSLLI